MRKEGMTFFEFLNWAKAKAAEHGLVVDDINADGELHRCGTESKPRGKAGVYVCHFDDLPLIYIGNWQTQTFETFFARSLDSCDNATRKRAIERAQELKRRSEEEQRKRWACGARTAFYMLRRGRVPNPQHAYLVRKQIAAPMGVLQDRHGCLLVPVYNENGKVQSVQKILPEPYIDANGNKSDKYFIQNGRTKFGHFIIPAMAGKENGPALIAEGLATGMALHMATGLEVWICFTCHNMLDVARLVRGRFPKRKICLCADNDRATEHKLAEKFGKDKATNPGVKAATEAAEAIGACLAVCPALSPENLPQNDDFADLYLFESKSVREVIDQALGSSSQGGIICRTLDEYCARKVKPVEFLLDPIIAKGSLGMIYGPTGLGKTHLALAIAKAVATGGKTLRGWTAPQEGSVLVIDGEMPDALMYERATDLLSMFEDKTKGKNFRLIAYGDEENGNYNKIPNLGTKEGQEQIEPFLEGVDLLILDNILSLIQTGKSNDADAWLPVQEWLSSLRRRGISVLLVHHTGKSGSQLGTSRKEINLDLNRFH